MKLTVKIDTARNNQGENDLVEGCIRKDYKAQKQLFDLYKDAMYTIAFRMLNDGEEANDVLQEAFIQVFRDIAKVQKGINAGRMDQNHCDKIRA